MKANSISLLLAGLLAPGFVHADTLKPGGAVLPPVDDFVAGSKVIAKVIAVTDTTITARSLSTGFEKKLRGKMSPAMLGKCISVVKLNEQKFSLDSAVCPPSHDTAAKAELKRELDAAARPK